PTAQGPPAVNSRGEPVCAAVLPSCGAPSDSPAAAPSSAPRKRAFSSICCWVMALGCFLRMFGSGRKEPMAGRVPLLGLCLQFALHPGDAIVAPEAALADEE